MNYETSEKKPSKMFLKTLWGGGSSSVYCNCGRQHYAPRNLEDSYEERDYPIMLADILEEQKQNTDGVIINHEDDFIYTKDIDNKTFVIDCPCNGLRRYEEWIWNHREIIRDYLKVRVEQEARWAEQELILNKLAGI